MMEVEMTRKKSGSGSWREGDPGEDRRSSVDSDSGPPPSAHLLASLANQYSLYLKTDLSTQISKVEEFLEESAAKLDEFQSLFEMKESERRAWIAHILPDVIRTGSILSVTLNQRLDTMASLILSVQTILDALEAQLSQAEVKVGLPSPSSGYDIRSVFKYFELDVSCTILNRSAVSQIISTSDAAEYKSIPFWNIMSNMMSLSSITAQELLELNHRDIRTATLEGGLTPIPSSKKYVTDPVTSKSFQITSFPLNLDWAFAVHVSQGSSME